MEEGSFLRLWSTAQRAGDSVLSSRGRFEKLRIASGRMARPSCTRFHAASKRSSASAAAPRRISSFVGIALEVVAQLLDRAEGVLALVIVSDSFPAQAVAEIVVQLDLEPLAGVHHHRFL